MFVLDNNFVVKSRYRGKSKFGFWTNLKEGDVLNVSLSLKDPGRGANGLYATNLVVTCNGEKFVDSLTVITKYLSKIDLEQIDE